MKFDCNQLKLIWLLVGAWPWITLLGFRDAITKKVDYLCGGALITDQHVITAAHCVKDKEDL